MGQVTGDCVNLTQLGAQIRFCILWKLTINLHECLCNFYSLIQGALRHLVCGYRAECLAALALPPGVKQLFMTQFLKSLNLILTGRF